MELTCFKGKAKMDNETVQDLEERLGLVEAAATGAGISITAMGLRVTELEGAGYLNEAEVNEKVNVVGESVQEVKVQLEGVHGSDQRVTTIENGLKSLGQSIGQHQPGSSLATKKKTLKESRAEVMTSLSKMGDRLDSLHYATFTLIGVFLTFSILFYSKTQSDQTLELVWRIFFVILTTALDVCLLWLLYQKIMRIGSQVEKLDERFVKLKGQFIDLENGPAFKEIEVDGFNTRSVEEISTASSVIYFGFLFVVVLASACLMIFITVENYKHMQELKPKPTQ